MQTLKTVEPKKIVTWSLVVVFSFLQIVPTGWAVSTPANELRARSVSSSVDALANPAVATKPAPAQQAVTFVDSTAFQLNENPLSPATPETKKEVVLQSANTLQEKTPLPISTVVAPKDTTVITDPNSGRQLSVKINDRGIATVTWGDQEYKGFFDARTNSVILVTKDDSIWTLQFEKNENGGLYLQSFQSKTGDLWNSSEETYAYDPQGQLTRKDWYNESNSNGGCDYEKCLAIWRGFSSKSGGTIDYVQINGKTLVSHEKSWSENDGMIYYEYDLTRSDDPNSPVESFKPYPSNRSESESWYSYDNQGNLAARSWANNNAWSNSYGQETYIQKNGKTLLSSSKVFQYGSPRKWILNDVPIIVRDVPVVKDPGLDISVDISTGDAIKMPPMFLGVSTHSENFYAYDEKGNLISEISASEWYDYSNVRHTSGYYWLRDAAKNTWTYASAEGIDSFAVWFRQDIAGINAAAKSMMVYVGGNGDRWNYTHQVAYTRNADNTMTAKAVYDTANHVFIVRGAPDVLSGETNDIKLVNGQQTNGQTVYYQEYWHSDATGNWVNDGYRLIFYDQSTWAQTAVDFPAQDTVTLNGKEYKITLDQDGKLTLSEDLATLFVGAFDLLNSFGDEKTPITIEDVAKMRDMQAALKAAVEALPLDQRAEWIKKFNNYLNQSDQIVASKPLKIVLKDGREMIIRNTADTVAQIIQRFRMMDQSGVIDLTRLAGISKEDMAGLETFEAYINSRKIGTGPGIPVFDLLSPLGNLTLLDRLVRKYSEQGIVIAHQEGPVLVVDEDFLRSVDGTKPVFDKVMQIAKNVFEANQVHIPDGPLTLEKIHAVLAEIAKLNSELGKQIAVELGQYKGESVFKDLLINSITQELMWGKKYTLSYGEIWQQLNNALNVSDMVYVIDGQEIRVSRAELDGFTNGLPYDLANLLRYPGVAKQIDPSVFSGLISSAYYNQLGSLDLRSFLDPAQTPSDAGSAVYFSYPAKRFELLEVFLKTWKETINANGTVNFDRLRFRLLISYDLELALGRAEEYLAAKTAEMEAFLNQKTFTMADYANMKSILAAVKAELNSRFQPLLVNVIYDTTNEVTARVNARYQALIAAFNKVVDNVSITVTLNDGNTVVINPRQINENVLGKILNATSIRYYGDFLRSGYLRMNGIDEGMLAELLSPEAMATLQSFNFYNYNNSWESQRIAAAEILFSLIPQLVQKLGTGDADLLTAGLTKGVYLPVPLGEVLETRIYQTVQSLSQGALQAMGQINVRTIQDLLALRDIFVQYHQALNDQLSALSKNLSDEELGNLEYWINYNVYATDNLNSVRNQFNSMVGNIQTLEVNGITVPVQQILNISNFPWDQNFDSELFPGLVPEDFEKTELAAAGSSYQYFYFRGREVMPSTQLSVLGRIQLVVNIVERLSRTDNIRASELNGVIFVNAQGKNEIDPEALRKYIKGVLAMQQAIIAEAKKRVQAVADELNGLKKGTYTLAEIQALHEKVLQLRADLIAFMEEKAGKHERQDVIATEDQVSIIFQEKVFDLFVSIVGAANLVISINGQSVVVPAKAITDALIVRLKAEFGDSIAAHHFARLYGISVSDIRGLNKLENYLGEQMIVLPRNSEYVQIVSQISELGYMELAVLLVERYAGEVIKNGVVDVQRLVELVADKDKAVTWVKAQADSLYFQKRTELEAYLKRSSFTLKDLENMSSIMDDVKIGLVSMMNDFLSGQKDDALQVDLEKYINSLYGKMKDLREEILIHRDLEVVINGQTAHFRITPENRAIFIGAIEKYLVEHPAVQSPKEEIVYEDTLFLAMDSMVSDAGYKVSSLSENVPVRGVAIWNPIPNLDLTQRPTQFGMDVLFARLVVKYGEFVFAPNTVGQYELDMNLFIQELQKTDQSRAERRLQVLLDQKLPEAERFINGLRVNGALPVDKLKEINDYYLGLKATILVLGKDASNKAQEVWAKFMGVYEAQLFSGKLSVTVKGRQVTFDAKVLDEILMTLYRENKLDPELMKKFSEMISAGENIWQYNDFRYMRIYVDYWGGGLKQSLFTEKPIDGTDLPSQVGTFTLGDLLRITGISRNDLVGLDVVEKDALQITPVDPELLLGLLDMRTMAPGSGVDVGGMMNASKTMLSSSLVSEVRLDYIELGRIEANLDWTSGRFRLFELIPSMIQELEASVINDNNEVDADLFRESLQLPAAVRAYVHQLRGVFKGFDVKPEFVPSTLCPQGAECKVAGEPAYWKITVSDPAKVLKPGLLREVVIKLEASDTDLKEPALASTVISAKYDAIENLDVPLLVNGLRDILTALNTVCDQGLCTTKLITTEDILTAMAELHITEVDKNNTIHFEWKGQPYEIETPEVKAIKVSVVSGLLNTFGFSKLELDQLIKDGKIVVTVDLEHLTATVTIDPSVTAPAGTVNMLNPLWLTRLPVALQFQLGLTKKHGYETPFYYLVSGTFQSKQYSYEMSYEMQTVLEGPVCHPGEACPKVMYQYTLGTNRIASVTIYDENPGYVCDKAPCHEVMETIQYMYPQYSKEDLVLNKKLPITASIVYHHPVNGVASREVTLIVMEDGQQHIQTVTDKDADGNVILTSQFNYIRSPAINICPIGGTADCVPVPARIVLYEIARTDATGNLLSTIAINNGSALITLSDGRTKEIQYASLEQLLDSARQYETEPMLPSIPAYVLPYVLSHFGISQEDIVTLNKIEAGVVCLGSGCPSWAFYIELTAKVNGKEVLLSGMVDGPRWDGPIGIDPLPAKTLPSLSSASVAESSVEAETSSALSSASLQSSPIVSSSPKKIRSRSAKRSLVSARSQADSSSSSSVYQQATSLKASPVFGFEGNVLFGNILTELTQ